MCGIVGIMANQAVGQELYDSLTTMQHRGQDAAGIVTYNGKLHTKRGKGYVRDIFHQGNIQELLGDVGIGHVRYATAGSYTLEDVMPFFTNDPHGIVISHNGNLTNYAALKKELQTTNRRYLNSTNDSEALLNVFAAELSNQASDAPFHDQVFGAVKQTAKRVQGAYSVVIYIAGKGLVAFRDPYGIRPLVMGVRSTDLRPEYIFASENVMFNILGYKFLKDVNPGSVVFIDERRQVHEQQFAKADPHLSIFEFVYFARQDAILDNISVYKARMRMGQKLADRLRPRLNDLAINVVVPVPSTANTVALSLASTLGLKYREGLVKNQFIGRTFIMPGQQERRSSVRFKLSPNELELRGKNVLLVDDSIVRGNTSGRIISIVRAAGAKKVYFASASPPVQYPDVYGIDMPTRSELIAHNMDEAAIARAINADFLVYQTIDDLIDAVRTKKSSTRHFDTACFTGEYCTPEINEEILRAIETARLEGRGSLNADIGVRDI